MRAVNRLAVASTLILAGTLAATINVADAEDSRRNRKPTLQLNQSEMQKAMALRARAMAAKNGAAKLSSGDVSHALGLAQQMGLTPKELAARIHARGSSNPAIKKMSKAQLEQVIRQLAAQHGARLGAAKKTIVNKGKQAARKPATKKTVVKKTKGKMSARKTSATQATRKSTTNKVKSQQQAAAVYRQRLQKAAADKLRARAKAFSSPR